MNFLSRCILGCLGTFCILSTSFAQQTNGRKRELFNDGWKFQLGNAADVAKDANYGLAVIFSKSGKAENTAIAPKFNDSAWRRVQLPHDWAVELPFVNKDNENLKDHGYRPVGGLFRRTALAGTVKNSALPRQIRGGALALLSMASSAMPRFGLTVFIWAETKVAT
jgi:beta-galactosidase